MMKPAKSKPLSPIMERHTPQHPLPEEIKNLPQDETICQFCGVSYLIHHEIKRLEELVEDLEKELELNRGAVAREQKLRDELEKNKNAVEYTNKILSQKEEIITKIAGDVEELKSSNEKLRVELSSEHQKRNNVSNRFLLHKQTVASTFFNFQNETQILRAELLKAKADTSQMIDDFTSSINSLLSSLPEFARSHEKEILFEKNKNEELTKQLRDANAETCRWMERITQYEAEIKTLKDNISLSGLTHGENEEKLKERVSELEDKCRNLEFNAKASEAQAKSLQTNTALMEDKLRKKQSELQGICIKLQKTEENASNTIQRMTQECRDAERELITTRDELKKLKDAQKQKDKKQEELFKQASLHNCQIEEITKALAVAKASNESLIEERSLMVMSHQHQIEQLRENFKRMLEERDGSVNAQKELDIVHQKHKEAMTALEQNLKSEFHIEMSVEKDKHSQALSNMKNQHQNEIKELQSQHQSAISSFTNQVAVLSQKLQSLSNSTQEKQKQCEEEKKTLKDLISHLETRITELTGEQQDDVTLKKLQIVAVNQKLEESLKDNERLEQSMLAMKEEINLLQDTVRRECEERFELTEALSHARQQFKEGKNASSVSLNLLNSNNPVSALNKLNPNGIEAEPSNRLSNRTLRSLESEYSSPPPGLGRNGQMPSLRSLPDVLPRPNPNQNHSRTSPYHDAVSANITDISFGGKDGSPRRSNSNCSLNGHHYPERSPSYNPGKKVLTHSESAESVNNVRKRIAAAIKRK